MTRYVVGGLAIGALAGAAFAAFANSQCYSYLGALYVLVNLFAIVAAASLIVLGVVFGVVFRQVPSRRKFAMAGVGAGLALGVVWGALVLFKVLGECAT